MRRWGAFFWFVNDDINAMRETSQAIWGRVAGRVSRFVDLRHCEAHQGVN
jgi:hypothetical protein